LNIWPVTKTRALWAVGVKICTAKCIYNQNKKKRKKIKEKFT